MQTFASKEAMTDAVKARVAQVKVAPFTTPLPHQLPSSSPCQEKTGALPRVMVMGALGRCGKAATECAELAGLSVTKWDMAETQKVPVPRRPVALLLLPIIDLCIGLAPAPRAVRRDRASIIAYYSL